MNHIMMSCHRWFPTSCPFRTSLRPERGPVGEGVHQFCILPAAAVTNYIKHPYKTLSYISLGGGSDQNVEVIDNVAYGSPPLAIPLRGEDFSNMLPGGL